ncbi:unnamed protein product [Lymnaea stagnalis]|uniref:Reelin domain-containing protein n=1 Tax=Lymnaea stagnalis TaxID=6523 RepID=A0AAV2IKF9_LYMST
MTSYLVSILFLLRVTWAYPGGVPDTACSSMFPTGHSSHAQTSASPYKIVLNKSVYNPGETIKVDVYGDQIGFSGIYIQPRLAGCHVNATRTVGVFTVSDPQLQTRHCFGVIHSTVSHVSSAKKRHVSFYWTAPVLASGHVVIRATIVQDRQTFWVDVESPALIDLQSKDTPTCVSHTHQEGYDFDHDVISYQAKKSLAEGATSGTENIARRYWTLPLLLVVIATPAK